MKGNSKPISGDWLCPLGAQNKDLGATSQTLPTEVKLSLRRRLATILPHPPPPKKKKIITILAKFSDTKKSQIENFKPQYILWRSPLLEIQSIPWECQLRAPWLYLLAIHMQPINKATSVFQGWNFNHCSYCCLHILPSILCKHCWQVYPIVHFVLC